METKKSPIADLESKKNLFLEVGLSIALLVTFGAFEWSTYNLHDNAYINCTEVVDIEEDFVPITRVIEQPTPPPPPAPKPVDIIEIVDDDDLIDDVDFASTECGDDDAVDFTSLQVEATAEDNDDDELVCFFSEVMPQFVGGEAALRKYLAESVVYPPTAIDNEIQGRVFVSFVIDKTGAVTNVHVARKLDPYLDREAVRVVQSMPRWTPGYQRGKPVNVAYTVPINFVLQH